MSESSRLDENVISMLRTYEIDHEILLIDPDYADTSEFCNKYQYKLEHSGNTIIVASKRGPKQYAACLVQAHTRLDVNKVVTRLMGIKRASFASADETKEVTGMLVGGVTPFGLPSDMPIFVDEHIKDLDYIILGSGVRTSKIKVAGSELSKIPNLKFVPDLSAVKQT